MAEAFTKPSLFAAYTNLLESECISDDCLSENPDTNIVDDNAEEP